MTIENKNSNKFMNTNNLFLDYFYMTFYFSKTTFNLFNYFYKKLFFYFSIKLSAI